MNYYLIVPKARDCEECGAVDAFERIHIGKAVQGYKFLFDTHYLTYCSWAQWKPVIEMMGFVIDEHEDELEAEDFFNLVKSMQKRGMATRDEDSYFDDCGFWFSVHPGFK